MRSAEEIFGIIRELYGVEVIGDPRDTETVVRDPQRGRWRSTLLGNSLAAYSTHEQF
jgi:hypothetical protein